MALATRIRVQTSVDSSASLEEFFLLPPLSLVRRRPRRLVSRLAIPFVLTDGDTIVLLHEGEEEEEERDREERRGRGRERQDEEQPVRKRRDSQK